MARGEQEPHSARVAEVTARAAALVRDLDLSPHPEGGFYRELFRSTLDVQPADDRDRRAALTTTYFLLPGGAVSRWHAVRSDEVWHFYEGAPLELWTMPPDFGELTRHRLGPLDQDGLPVWT